MTVICCGLAPVVPHALIAFGEVCPDISVTIEKAVGNPEALLTTAPRAAGLLVLGSRSRLVSWAFGSVSRNLIRRGYCQVVIARDRAMPTVPVPRDGQPEPHTAPCR